MLGIPLALAYANAGEWLIHRYVLHGLGKGRFAPCRFHFHEHHRATRKNAGYDPGYTYLGYVQGGELVSLALLGLAHLPLAPVAPFFTATVLYSLVRYHRVHKRAHLDPAWAREHLPWHWAHHMGADQEANWCITSPWFDDVMGTRR